MDAICERCGARVTGPACDLCGGTRVSAAPATAPAPVPHIAVPAPPAAASGPVGGDAATPPAAPPAAPPSASPAPPSDDDRPASRTRWSASSGGGLRDRRVLAVAAGVLVAAVILSVSIIMIRRGSASEPVAAVLPVPSMPAPSTSRPTVDTTPAGAEAIRCWDDTTAETIADCTMPSGKAGLRYVYPGYDRGRSCTYKAYRTTTSTFDCDVAKGVLRFRWWQDTDEASGHYTNKYRKGSTTELVLDGQRVGTLYRDRKQVKKGIYRLSGFLWDHFSFSVEAKSKARVDSLLKLIEIRHPDDIAGYQLDSGPMGTVGVRW